MIYISPEQWARVLPPVRRTAIAHLPFLGGVAVAHATEQLIRTLSTMGPCDWTTLTVGVVGGQLVAQADALDPPPTRTPTPPHPPHAEQTR